MSSLPSLVAEGTTTLTALYRGRLLRYAYVDGAAWWAVPDIGAALDLSREDGSLTYRLGKLPTSERRLLPISTTCGIRKIGVVSQGGVMRLAADLQTRAARKLLGWLTSDTVRAVMALEAERIMADEIAADVAEAMGA